MITDARALQPRYVPQDLAHREGQIEALATWLEPIASGDSGEHALLFGPSGSGKTTLAKYVADRLERDRLGVRWGYVNCMSESTPGAALHTLVREMGLGTRRPSGTPRQYYLDRLREADGQLVAIIDEVNVLTEFNPLHALYACPGVTLIAICIDEDTLLGNTSIEPQTRSRLRSMQTLRLNAYSHAELVDIVEARVNHGLVASRVTDAAIDEIADRAVGNARDALALLRQSAKYVVESEVKELTAGVVETVTDDAQAAIRQQHVRSLGTHKRALYEIVRSTDEIEAQALHEQYEDRVQEPRTKRTRRRYLDSLVQYELIEKAGQGRGTTYRLRGTADAN